MITMPDDSTKGRRERYHQWFHGDSESKGDEGQPWRQPCSVLKYSEYTSLVWTLALGDVLYIEGKSTKALLECEIPVRDKAASYCSAVSRSTKRRVAGSIIGLQSP